MTASLIQKLAAYECEVAQLKVENAKLAEQVEHYREVIAAMVIQPESIQLIDGASSSTIVSAPNLQPYNLGEVRVGQVSQDRETFREAYKDCLSKLR